MPTYQYACTACGENLEAVQSFTDAALTECPACGGALRKVFSAVGVVFKGSGFYKTDSRSSSKASAPAADSSSKASSSESSSSDSKPAATKTESKPAAAASSTTSTSTSTSSASGTAAP